MMTAEQVKVHADDLRRRRFPFALFHSTIVFKTWSEEAQHVYETRVGVMCGPMPATAEAHVIARGEAEACRE